MRNLFLLATLLLVSLSAYSKEPTLESLRSRAETASPKDCPKVCLEYARAAAEEGNRKFTDGDVDNAHKLMNDAASFAIKAGETSMSSRKHQKQTEIGLRKFSSRMEDIKNSLNLDDRAPLTKHIQAVDAVRERLLSSMFGDPPTTLEKAKNN